MTNTQSYQVNEKGYYGSYGGAFIPEMLYPNVEELRQKYLEIMNEGSFQEEWRAMLRDYVGRPTPLYYAKRLSEHYKTNIYLYSMIHFFAEFLEHLNGFNNQEMKKNRIYLHNLPSTK